MRQPRSILNLSVMERFKPENIFLPLCACAAVYKKHGMARVRNAVSQDGVQHDEPNFAADLRALQTETSVRWMTLPDDDNGGTREVRLVRYSLFGAMDYLGANPCTNHVESPKAHQFCRTCDYDKRSPDAGMPFSFLRTCKPAPGEAKAARRGFSARKWASEQRFAAYVQVLLRPRSVTLSRSTASTSCLLRLNPTTSRT